MPAALITGASSGIGYATAAQLIGLGWRVFGVARRTSGLPPGVIPIGINLSVPGAVSEAFSVEPLAGSQIELVIHSAGYGDFAPVELTPVGDAAQQMQVNVLSAVEILQQVLPGMRNSGGRIVFISSVASQFSSPMGGWYHASKAALESLADAMRQELKQFRIDVAIVQPSRVETPWHTTAVDRLESLTEHTAYEQMAVSTAAYHRRAASSAMTMPVDSVADVVVSAATARKPRTRYAVGRGSRTALALPRLVSDRTFDRLTAREFGLSKPVRTTRPG